MKVIAFVVSYRSESSFPSFLLHSHGALRCTSETKLSFKYLLQKLQSKEKVCKCFVHQMVLCLPVVKCGI